MINYSDLFIDAVHDDSFFKEAMNIIHTNSQGGVWLIGGFVYRTLVSQLYAIPKLEVDIDCIVEHPINSFTLPDGWSVSHNRFGNPKLICDTKEIDYVPLDSIYSIKARNLPATIENYLSGTPLNIQSIVFDVKKNKIIGSEGLFSLENRLLAVNNPFFARYAMIKKGTDLQTYISDKAKSLGFNYILF